LPIAWSGASKKKESGDETHVWQVDDEEEKEEDASH
tara:strand:+ start:334 stop:441 length:108 start_codon:yes stop_codon:yes gene_type:complete